MEDRPNETARDASPQSEDLKPKVYDHELLARLVIREGKPFRSSAIEAGYSAQVARNGLKRLMDESNPVSEAIRAEWERFNVTLDRMKPFAVRRLYREIVDMESPYAMRAIELAGRFRETDWFVRNTEMQLGIFVGMTEQPAQDTIEITPFKE